jgi:hypothetical protein
MSGTTISSRMTLPIMKQNPMRVTMFGASHLGRNSTIPFHSVPESQHLGAESRGGDEAQSVRNV